MSEFRYPPAERAHVSRSGENAIYVIFPMLVLMTAALSMLSIVALLSVDAQRKEALQHYARALMLARDSSSSGDRMPTPRMVAVRTTLGTAYTLGLRREIPDLVEREIHEFALTGAAGSERATQWRHAMIAGAVLCELSVIASFGWLLRLKRSNERSLRQAHERYEEIAAVRKGALLGVSHDLQGLLQAVGLSFEFAQRRIAGRQLAKAEDALDMGIRASRTMKEFIQILLDQAQWEAGSVPLSPSNVDVVELLEEARNLLSPVAMQKSIKISLCTPKDMPSIFIDRRQMLRVLNNILSNALKFTPIHGRIDVDAGIHGRMLRISIADTGPGIPRDSLGKVFETFWQAHPKKAGGKGLGLAIAKSIVEKHRGKIWAESDPGRGALIRLELPC